MSIDNVIFFFFLLWVQLEPFLCESWTLGAGSLCTDFQLKYEQSCFSCGLMSLQSAFCITQMYLFTSQSNKIIIILNKQALCSHLHFYQLLYEVVSKSQRESVDYQNMPVM